MAIPSHSRSFTQNPSGFDSNPAEMAEVELPAIPRDRDRSTHTDGMQFVSLDGGTERTPSPEEKQRQEAVALIDKHRTLIKSLPDELARGLFQRSPMRVSLQFLKDLDDLSKELGALPEKDAKGNNPRAIAISKLAVTHLQGQALIRTAVAEELLIAVPQDLQADLRTSLTAAMKKVEWTERRKAVQDSIAGFMNHLKNGSLAQEKELGAFLESVQTAVKGNNGLPVTNPQQLKNMAAELSKITGRPVEEFPFPPTGLSLEAATIMVNDTLTTEYLIDQLALTYHLGNKGKALPDWDTIKKSLEKDLSGMRNTERDQLVGGILHRLKGYSKLKERRDEIIRIGDRQVDDSTSWDVYIPFWHAHYMFTSDLTTTQHSKDFEKVKLRDRMFSSVQKSLGSERQARQTLFVSRELQSSVESELKRRGAWLIDSKKSGYYNPAAADFQAEFNRQRTSMLRELRK